MFSTVCRTILTATVAIASTGLHNPDRTSLPEVVFTLGQMGVEPPIKVTQIFIGSRSIALEKPVLLEKGWIANTEVDVQNVSSKDIVAGDAILVLLGAAKGSEDNPYPSSVSNLGRYPDSAFRHKDGSRGEVPEAIRSRPEVRISPGETMRFRFSLDGAAVETTVNSKGSISKVRVTLASFYFADGSKWSHGTYLIPTSPPQLWNIVSFDEFTRFALEKKQ